MSRMLFAALVLAAVLLAAAGICSGQDYAEIRGPVSYVKSGETYTLGPKDMDNKFYGFFYDIDDDLGTESITLSVSIGDLLDGEATPAGVQYSTEVQRNRFELEDWGAYDSIGFLGDNYFAGYISDAGAYLAKTSDNQDLLSSEMISRVLNDSDDEMTLASGTTLPLKEGYEIRIVEVDVNGNQVYVNLYRNGARVAQGVVTTGTGSIGDSTFCYKKDSGDTSGLVSIAAHFRNAFRGSDRNYATVDGVFQISEMPEHVSSGSQYDKMRISSVTSSRIEMDNKDNTIHLSRNRDIPLMRGLRIRTSDQDVVSDSDPLRFYLYKRLTEPGLYQVNGRADVVVDGREADWDSRNFPGFYYDLDHDVGSESLSMKISGYLESGVLNPNDVAYRTRAMSVPFKHKDWGGYYVAGFLGERYLAGYSASGEGRTAFLQDSSDRSNLMEFGLLSRILIDSDDDINLTSGSVYPLKEGYELRIKGIDLHGNSVDISLARDGMVIISDYVVELSENPTFRYKAKLDDMSDVPLIAVNFRTLMTSSEISVAEIEGIWQISEDTIKIAEGMKLGKMTIFSVDSKEGEMSIEATNKDATISLGKDRTVGLIGDYYIKTADQNIVSEADPLRFFIFKEVSVAGSGEDAERRAATEAVASEQPVAVQDSEDAIEPGKPSAKPEEQKKQPGFPAILAFIAIGIFWRATWRDE
ncbi:MAG: S-layer protein [Methanothrix sp.]|nr:MAG: S-layer protein [Methanothrix sp.]